MYNYLYLDTNVFSDIAKNKESWNSLKNYMKKRKFTYCFYWNIIYGTINRFNERRNS